MSPGNSSVITNRQEVAFLHTSMVLANPAPVDADFLVEITADPSFRPSFEEATWDYTNGSGTIHIPARTALNVTFVPRLISTLPGTYHFDIVVSHALDPSVRATAQLTVHLLDTGLLHLDRDYAAVAPDGSATFAIILSTLGHEHIDITTSSDGPSCGCSLKVGGATVLEGEGTYTVPSDVSVDTNVTLVVNSSGLALGGSRRVTVDVVSGGTHGTFGIFHFIVGTAVTTAIALLVAVPLGLGTAIYLAEYCPARLRRVLRPLTELLAGVPSVVYGLWGWFTVAPFLGANIFPLLGGQPSDGQSLLAAGLILGIMVVPFMTVLSEGAIRAVHQDMKDSSLALGCSKWQTVRHVILPRARSGIGAAVVISTGRAIGETMAVLMVMGAATQFPTSLFDPGATMTSVIAVYYDEVLTLELSRHAIFAIALVLFLMVFALNLLLLRSHRRATNAPSQRAGGLLRRFGARKPVPLERAPPVDGVWAKTSPMGAPAPAEPPTRPQIKGALTAPSRINRSDKAMRIAVVVATGIVVLALLAILIDVVTRGGASLRPEFLWTEEEQGGLAGGYANAVSGSLALVGGALLFATPIALLSAIYIREFANRDNRLIQLVLFASDTLASTPSIVFGAFGFAFFVIFLGFRFSLIAGIFTLGLMILPILLRSCLEALDTVPMSQREAALALGATRWQAVRQAVLPASSPLIMSGVILGIGRSMGETAAVLLTAGYGGHIVSSPVTPAASMPVLIYDFFERSARFPILKEKVYSVALLLILIVLSLNIAARFIEYRASKVRGT
jgi:phosphate transport system permease protein